MDQAGDMAAGYSVSAALFVPLFDTPGVVPTDPAGTMQAEVNVVSGAGSQTGSLSRWGDYSAMQVDPVDDCTFWYTQEYMKTTGSFNWNTRIAKLQVPGLPGGTPTPDYTIGASPSSLPSLKVEMELFTITVTSLNGFNAQPRSAPPAYPAA